MCLAVNLTRVDMTGNICETEQSTPIRAGPPLSPDKIHVTVGIPTDAVVEYAIKDEDGDDVGDDAASGPLTGTTMIEVLLKPDVGYTIDVTTSFSRVDLACDTLSFDLEPICSESVSHLPAPCTASTLVWAEARFHILSPPSSLGHFIEFSLVSTAEICFLQWSTFLIFRQIEPFYKVCFLILGGNC